MIHWLKTFYVDSEFKNKREFLERVAVLKWIPRREFGALFHSLVLRDYREGEALFEEGEIGRALFILVSGDVEVTRKGKDGKPRRITMLKEGDCFGEIALVDQLPRIATARATSMVRAYLLYKAELEKLAVQSPRVALAIIGHGVAVLGNRLRELTNQIAAHEDR